MAKWIAWCLVGGVLCGASAGGSFCLQEARPLQPIVESESEVYRYTPADNGAGPMWCAGSTTLVRVGDRLFASGLETVADQPPLNNCRWVVWEHAGGQWLRRAVDPSGLTREPCPLAAVADDHFFLSGNPTLNPVGQSGGGAARPMLYRFEAADSEAPPIEVIPEWSGEPPFTEHSYRSLAADAREGELLLLQNIGYTHAEWTFRDGEGKWAAHGRLEWPWGAEYETPQPIRVCYPCVALRGRAVYFFGVSDIVEPNSKWRAYKKQLTGRDWDYDFRRLFFTWTPDITQQPFAPWQEIASREATAGFLWPCDLWVASDGGVHLAWAERALDERLRDEFFPQEKQSHQLIHAILIGGELISRQVLTESNEGEPGVRGTSARFHAAPDGRLFLVYYAVGSDPAGQSVSENRVVEIGTDGQPLAEARIPLQPPFTSFFTATPRAGSAPAPWVDLLGERQGLPNTISHARVRLE